MKPKIHFHSLEALRFFAFLKVYLLHVPIQGDFPVFGFLKGGGGLGVYFFFVLSGFLITYLLTLEKANDGSIDLSNFIVRRSLRIWPLYFLMVVIAVVLPYSWKDGIGFHMVGGGYDFDWKTSFTFLQNYKMLAEDNFPKTTPLSVFWSLCIEVHFYLFWGAVLYFLPMKKFLNFFMVCFALAWLARFIEPFIISNERITTNDLFTNLDLFAAGGLLGYFVATKNHFLEQINGLNRWIKYLIITWVLCMIIFQNQVLPYVNGSFFNLIRPTIISVSFAALIALFLPMNSSIRIKSRVLNYLGTISYGLYVFHIIMIHVVFQYFIKHGMVIDNWYMLALFLFITAAGSLILSMLSYQYYELPFLKWRDRLMFRKSSSFENE